MIASIFFIYSSPIKHLNQFVKDCHENPKRGQLPVNKTAFPRLSIRASLDRLFCNAAQHILCSSFVGKCSTRQRPLQSRGRDECRHNHHYYYCSKGHTAHHRVANATGVRQSKRATYAS